MEKIQIKTVSLDTIDKLGLYCAKDTKSDGYKSKRKWFEQELENGLQLCIAQNEEGESLGFIEFIPAENAWRPIKAPNFYFIQCIVVYSKKARRQDVGSTLIEHCVNEAKRYSKAGVCTFSSKGSWIASEKVFLKNKFKRIDQRGRFELLAKTTSANTATPAIINWEQQLSNYTGWNLLYANQCPWHIKSVNDLQIAAQESGVKLKVHELKTAKEAQNGPSGYGTFSLLHDGKLLADHYISKTRLLNILKKERVE